MLWTCECTAVNAETHRTCEYCGADRPATLARRAPTALVVPPPLEVQRLTRCPHDGERLQPNGFCELGQGFPHAMACPFQCPLCWAKLDWSGGCHECHGTKTGRREEWCFLGDGYYTHEVDGKPIGDGQHWVKQQGPRPAVGAKVNVAQMRKLGKILKPLTEQTEQETP